MQSTSASGRTLPERVLKRYYNFHLSVARSLTLVTFCVKVMAFPMCNVCVMHYACGRTIVLQVECVSIPSDATSQVALNALLERSREVLLQFTKDEALAGGCPLPR